MKIIELLSEQGTIGTTGSTTGPTNTINPVSNTPSDKPASATSPNQDKSQNPNLQKLAATLKQNKVIDNDADVNDFISGYQAQSSGKTLNPDQQASMSKLASAMLKDKTLGTNLDLQLKTMSANKPDTSNTAQQNPMQTNL